MSSLSYFSRFCHTLNSLIQLRMVSFGNLNDFRSAGGCIPARNTCCDNSACLILLRIPVEKKKVQHSFEAHLMMVYFP
jgi:hypothetical protein